jgi:hypothetical protein
MSKKIIRLSEKDIESLVGKIMNEESNSGSEKVNESLPKRERERKSTNFRKDTFNPYEREGQIMDIFGPYKNDVPPNVVSYMRKNPALIIKRLEQVYGRDKILRYLGIQE